MTRPIILRRTLAIIVALLMGVQVVRNAAVAAFADSSPDLASRAWAGHPDVEISQGLTEIARASRARSPLHEGIFRLIDDAAVKSPLSPEPFLVKGVQAKNVGNLNLSERAFHAAQFRDPRSLAAAFFLADIEFRSGDSLAGLRQTALLARLSPGGNTVVAPFVAAYAADQRNWPQLRRIFHSDPALEDAVLMALSKDPRNADALLALADIGHRRSDSPWLSAILTSLVSAGNYSKAHELWVSIGGGSGKGLLFDNELSDPEPPPPFNWGLSAAGAGLAERQPGGRLHVLFYGNSDGVLANQLVLLRPGRYRLSSQIVGTATHAEALRWSVSCDKSTEPLATGAIGDVATHGLVFEVPANCRAQWLELSGRSGDVAQQAEAVISHLSLESAPGDA